MDKKLPTANQEKSIQDLYSENPNLVTIQKAAQVLGVSKDTLRRWEAKGKISSIRTATGYRLYDIKKLTKKTKNTRPAAVTTSAPEPLFTQSALPSQSSDQTTEEEISYAEEAPYIAPAVETDPDHSFYSKHIELPPLNLSTPTLQAEEDSFSWPAVESVKISTDDQTFSQYATEKKISKFSVLSSKMLNRKVYTSFSVVFTIFIFLIASSLYLPGFKNTGTGSLIAGFFTNQGSTPVIEPTPEIAKASAIHDVLAVSSIATSSKYLELNLDTNITGNLAVEGEGVFTENITAPNIIYSLVAGNNITISGDPQNPVIAATAFAETDTLQSVTARGATTTIASVFSGGLTTSSLSLTGALNMGQLSDDPASAVNGTTYYNTGSNKFRCYISGSWRDCDTDTDTDTITPAAPAFGSIALTGDTGTAEDLEDGDTILIAGSNGITTATSATDTLTISLSLSTSSETVNTSSNSGLELSADGISMLRGCANGQLLKWNETSKLWECGSDVGGLSSAVVDIREGDTPVGTNVTVLNFTASDFTITESPSGQDNFAIDYANSGITRKAENETIAGNWVFTNGITLGSGETVTIGTIGLSDAGSNNLTSGATQIGVFDEFSNSSSTTLQQVLNDLDSAIGGGASKWTDSGSITYLTSTSDDVAVGGTTLAAPFSVDVSANTVRIGSGSTNNGTLSLYASDGDTGDLLYNTSDQFQFSGGSVLIDSGFTVSAGTVTVPAGSIDNSELANSAVTVNTSGPLGGGGAVSLGGTLTLTCSTCLTTASTLFTFAGTSGSSSTITSGGTVTVAAGTGISTTGNGTGTVTVANTGVTSNVAGTGISVSGATGAVTITNTGVTSLDGGTGSIAVANATFSTGTLTIDDAAADGSTKGIAAFNATHFSASSGVISIANDGIALGTLTTGNYVSTITGNTQVGVSGSGSETAGVTLSINANSLTATELNPTLTFADGDYIDLSAILHDDSALQGLRLPNTGATPTNPTSGEGQIAYDATNNNVIYYNGSSWQTITTTGTAGDITDVLAGSGLTGGGSSGSVTLTIGGSSTITVNADDIAVTADSIGDTQLAFNTGQHLTSSSAVTFTSVDTGQGANELYDMDQNVLTTSGVTFATLDTGFGPNELYDMDQHVLTTSAVTFATLDTGQGANELYDMDQNVLTTSGVTFASLIANTSTGISIGAEVAGTNNTNGNLTFYADGDDGSNNAYTSLFTTGTQTQNITYTLPTDDGDNNYVLSSNGSGVLSWKSVTGVGGGTGTVTQIDAGNGISTGGSSITTSGTVSISLLSGADGTGVTSSRSGLEFGGASSNELTLLQGCTNNDMLLWDDSNNQWACGTVSGAGGIDGAGAANRVAYWSDNNTLTSNANFTFDPSATSGNTFAISNTGLTSGALTAFVSTNDSAADTAWIANSLTVNNAQGTTAVSTGSIYGFNLNFNQNTSIAGNTESAARIGIAQNNSASTDQSVSSILSLENDDTASGNQITATRGLNIDGANVTDGIYFNGTFGTNLINTSTGNFVLTQSGAITAATLDTGQGANELYDMDQNVLTTSTVTFATVDTGQGANELYDMDQNVLTTSAVTFATIDTGQGANELYDMDQNVLTTSAVTFATLDTGQGANELYDMDQNVLTTSSVTFDTLTLTNDLTVANGGTGASTFTSNGVLYGNGASAIAATTAGTDGQLLLGNTAGAPAFATMSADATITNAGVLTIAANAVALGTDTTGNYVATIAGSSQIGVSGSGSETAAVTLSLQANSVDASHLAASLSFADGDYIDLSAILHDDSALQGLRLPNTGATPTNPTSGEGQIAYDAVNNTVIYFDGSAWLTLTSTGTAGDITEVIAGAGLTDGGTTGAVTLNIGGSSTITVGTDDISVTADSIGDTQLAFNTGQHLTTSSNVTFATVDTGQGANELYDMDQNVLTTSLVTFDTLTLTNDLTVANGGTGASTFTAGGVLYGNGASALAATAQGTTGQALISGGAGSPTWTTGTLTLAGDFATSGANSLTLTTTGTTNVTLPTTGTLCSTSSCEDAITFSNGLTRTADAVTLGGALTANTTITQDSAETFTIANTGTGETAFDLTSTGDLNIKDNSTTFFSFQDNGTLAYTGGTGVTTQTAAGFTANSLTTGTLMQLTATALTSGSFFDVNNGSSIFNISQTGLTSSLPVNFTSPGDVAIAYDLNFTNSTASYINSAASLNIAAGEVYNSSNLYLRTYNQGTVVIDSGATTGTSFELANNSLTTGTGANFDFNGLTTGTGVDISSTSTAGGASGASYLLNLSRSGTNSNTAHTAYGIYSAVTNTNVTSGTNTAGYFSASGATTANYGIYVAAGNVNIQGLTASTAVYTDSNKNLTSTAPTSGTIGYWSRSGTTLSPVTAGDAVTTSGNISTTGSGTGTFAGLLTASAGLTIAANQNFTMSSGTGTFAQAYSGTGSDIHTLSVNSTNSSGTPEPVSFNLTNTLSGTASSYVGVDISYQNASTLSHGDTIFRVLAENNASGSDPISTMVRIHNNDADQAVSDAILITSTTTAISDALDLSDAEINNALNLGANFALFDGTRIFEGTTGTLTFEDTSGNDLCTLTDAGTTGNLACTGNITGPSTGTIGYWSRSGTTLSPTTANDIVSIANTTTTGADFALTNTGVYTGTGIVNLTANSATTGNLFNISATGLTTGEVMNIDATYAPSDGSTNDGIDLNFTHTPTASADNFTGLNLQVGDGTTLANTVYGGFIGVNSTGNAAKTLYGFQTGVQSSSTSADTLISLQAWGSITGALSTGTRSVYGVASPIASTAASTGGTLNLTGGRFTPSSTLSNPGTGDTATNNVFGVYTAPVLTLASDCTTNCTSNQYGLYAANGTSSTNGTSTKYGLYVEPQTGADNNYGAYFGSSVGIGTTAPSYTLDVVQNTASTPLYSAIRNTSNTSGADAIQYITSGGSSGGDAYINLSVGPQNWAVGIDNSNGDAFTIGSASTLGGATERLTILTTGNVGIGDSSPTAALTVGSGDLFQVNSSGAIAAITGYTQASGAFAFSGGGNFSVDSAAFDVNTSGAVSGVTTLTQSGLHTINQGSAVRSIDINDTAASPSTPVIDVNRTNNAGTPAITNAALYINDHSTNYLLGFETGTTDLLTFTGAGQLSLPVSGSGAGIVLGGDTNLYRSAADTLKTDDAFNVGGNFNVTAAGVISGATGLTSSGTINFSGLTASSAVYTDASKNLTSTAPTSGAIGYWSRSSTTLSPTTAGDTVLLDNNTAYQMKDSGGVTRSLVSLNSSDMQTFGVGAYNATYNGYRVDITSALPLGQTTDSAFDIKSSSDLGSADELVQFGDSAADFLTILGGGNVGIGDSSPAAMFTVGSSDAFQINSSGNIANIGGAAHTIANSAGALGIDSATTGAINIGTGASAKTITMGNATGATALAFNSGTGSQTFTSQVVSGTTTTSAFVFDSTALTTGTGSYFTSDSITQGKLMQIATTGNTLTTGTLADIRTTATSLTGTAGIGSLMNLDWSPGSATTATGDLFSLNIGTNGSTTGKLFNILDTASSIFSVSETSFTTSLPSNFTASGDVAIAYDINFTNPTASYIKSAAPLYMVAGESFNSSDLTLSTYNFGSVIASSSVTSGSGTKYNLQSIVSDSTTNANTINSVYSELTLTGNAAKTGAGILIGVSSTSTTGNTLFGGDFLADHNAAVTSGNSTLYGVRARALNDGITDTNGATIYGGHFTATGNAGGTSTGYGVYATASGSDNNYPFYSGVAFPTANTAGLCWDNSGESAIYDCNGTPTDLAENYGTTDTSIEAGDVVIMSGQAQQVLDPREGKITTKAFIAKANSSYQQNIIGIVSTNPNQVYGEDGLFSPNENPRPVSLAGRVPVKVSTENGAINDGDYLTSSSIPGVAMKATKPGVSLGRALNSFNGSGVGKVIVYVDTGFADPSDILANLTIGNDGSLLGSNITADKLTVSGDVTVGGIVSANRYNLDASTLNMAGSLASLPVDSQNRASIADALNILAQAQNTTESRIGDLEAKEASTAAALADAQTLGAQAVEQVASLDDKVASTSASVANLSSQIDALLASIMGDSNPSTPSASPTPSSDLALTPPSIMFASDSATLNTLTVTSEATVSGNLTAYEGIFQDSLKSLGDTFLGKTNIAGDLSVDGTFSISEGSIVNALPVLYFQTSPLAEAVDFFNGLVTISKDGVLAAKEIVTEQISVKADTSAGQTILPTGQTEVAVLNELVEDTSIIILTSETTGAPTLAVAEKVAGAGFVVRISNSYNQDIKFSYLIVGQR